MDKSAKIIYMPQLSDEAAVGVRSFLQELIDAVESQYFSQLRRYYSADFKDDDTRDIV
jgi:hypothetical protein